MLIYKDTEIYMTVKSSTASSLHTNRTSRGRSIHSASSPARGLFEGGGSPRYFIPPTPLTPRKQMRDDEGDLTRSTSFPPRIKLRPKTDNEDDLSPIKSLPITAKNQEDFVLDYIDDQIKSNSNPSLIEGGGMN